MRKMATKASKFSIQLILLLAFLLISEQVSAAVVQQLPIKQRKIYIGEFPDAEDQQQNSEVFGFSLNDELPSRQEISNIEGPGSAEDKISPEAFEQQRRSNLRKNKNIQNRISSVEQHPKSIQALLNPEKKDQELEQTTVFSLQNSEPQSFESRILQTSTSNTVVNTQFKDIGLYHEIPTTFKTGEVYQFRGKILNASLVSPSSQGSLNFVNVFFDGVDVAQSSRCSEEVDTETLQFSLSCKLDAPGRYRLSIFAGRFGTSSRTARRVVSDDKNSNFPQTPETPRNLRLEIIENDLYVRWDSESPLTKVTFEQSSLIPRTNEYYLSNYHRSFKVPFVDFRFFREELTTVSISHADSDDGTIYGRNSPFSEPLEFQFLATEHKFASSFDELTRISPPIPWKMQVGETFRVQGSFTTQINKVIYLVSPRLRIEKIDLNPSSRFTSAIRAGTPISFEISFNEPGAHVIEINAINGQAIINRPIYVGEGYPLTPDFEDLNQDAYFNQANPVQSLQQYVASTTTQRTVTEPAPSSSLSAKREYLLVLLNALRAKYGADPVYLDSFLSEVAQAHSQDMNQNNYFSHTDLLGRGPGQRAQAQGFMGPIGENLAQSNSLTQAHLQLERSAAHLDNSIRPNWARCGFGIATTSRNQYIVTVLFSTRDLEMNPLNDEEMSDQQTKLIQLILRRNPSITRENMGLSTAIKNWLETSRSGSIFDYLRSQGFRSSMAASTLEVSFDEDWVGSIEEDPNFLVQSRTYREVGAGFIVTPNNLVEAYVVFLA